MTIREPFNAISHAAGALLALIGSVFLLSKGGGVAAHTAALAVYGFSLVGLFSASGAYHWAVVKPAVAETAQVRPFRHLSADRRHIHTFLRDCLHRLLAVGHAGNHLVTGGCRHYCQAVHHQHAPLGHCRLIHRHGLVEHLCSW